MENHHGSSLIAAPFPDIIYTTLKSWPESEEFNHYCRVFFKFVQMPAGFSLSVMKLTCYRSSRSYILLSQIFYPTSYAIQNSAHSTTNRRPPGKKIKLH